jgi:hypothetical protein
LNNQPLDRDFGPCYYTDTATKELEMLATIRDFVIRVTELDSIHDAYYVFEEECTDALRDRIYGLAEGSAEPFRAAMHELGFTAY